MITPTVRAARTAAAFSILGREGVTINDRGQAFHNGIVQRLETQTRITMLAMILLDCFGYEDVERDAILKFEKNSIYRGNLLWLRKHLKGGAISQVIRDYMALGEKYA